MVSRRLVVVAVVLGVVALGGAAAGIHSFAEESIDEPDQDGDGEGPTGETPAPLDMPGWLFGVIIGSLLVLGAVAFVLLRTQRYRFLRNLAAVILLGMLFLLVVELVELPFSPGELGNATGELGDPDLEPGEGTDDNGAGEGSGLPVPTLVALLVAIIVGALIYLRTAAASPEPEDSEDEPDGPRKAVGRAAERAVDRLERDSLENAIYQAWYEMTAALSLRDTESLTPAEFREAAIEAGFAPDDVETLTDLFREVRYGDAPVTDERTRQARGALEGIQAVAADEQRSTGTDQPEAGESE